MTLPSIQSSPIDVVTGWAGTLRHAGDTLRAAAGELASGSKQPTGWLQRFIAREVERHVSAQRSADWEKALPGLTSEERACIRIRRMLTRATAASVVAAAGTSSAEVLSVTTEGAAAPLTLPVGLAAVAAEMLYTTSLQVHLAFDLAGIYGVPFGSGDEGEISTLLAMAVGVDLMREPSLHDQPTNAGDTKPWRVLRQMQRNDFARQVGSSVLQQSVLRNIVPIVGIVVSAVWNQVTLRRFARQLHTVVRQRAALVDALKDIHLPDSASARLVLDGAWLIATADGELGHREALALSTLIGALQLPERIAVEDASFTDDEEGWFERVRGLAVDAQGVLIDVLALVASADGDFTTPERRFLRRLSAALGRDIDVRAVEQRVARLRVGAALSSVNAAARATQSAAAAA